MKPYIKGETGKVIDKNISDELSCPKIGLQ
jgi:hypothetical protein